jgi:hypothetical protein
MLGRRSVGLLVLSGIIIVTLVFVLVAVQSQQPRPPLPISPGPTTTIKSTFSITVEPMAVTSRAGGSFTTTVYVFATEPMTLHFFLSNNTMDPLFLDPWTHQPREPLKWISSDLPTSGIQFTPTYGPQQLTVHISVSSDVTPGSYVVLIDALRLIPQPAPFGIEQAGVPIQITVVA